MKKAHVAEYKKRVVADFVKLIKEYPVVGALNVENLPTKQFQKMREQLRGKVIIRMTKRRLMKIALEKAKESKKGIEELEKHLEGMPALIFSKENPFKLNSMLKKSKSKAPAKAGQIAPEDIIIKAGPTPFAPGPVIGELGSIGLKTSVEAGKVAIVRDKVIVKEGEEVPATVTGVLARLGIMPMEIGLDLVAIYENGVVYKKDILKIDDEEYINNIKLSASEAFSLAIYVGYATKETVEFLIKKAFMESKAIALSQEILTDDVVEQMLSKAEKQAESLQGSAKLNVKEGAKKEEPSETKQKSVEIKETQKERVSKVDEKEIEKEEIKEIPEEKEEPVKQPVEEQKTEEVEKEEPKEEIKLKDLEDSEGLEVKEKITEEAMSKTEEFVKQLQQKAEEEKKKKPVVEEPKVPSVEEIVKKTRDFAEGKKAPSADEVLEKDSGEDMEREIDEKIAEIAKQKKQEKKEHVPTAHELAQRKRKS